MKKRVLLGAGLILMIAGGLAAACGTNTDDLQARIEALESGSGLGNRLLDLETQIERNGMVATLNVLDDVGFHELNMTIEADGIAPSGTVGTIRSALRAVAATSWPDDVAEDAEAMQEKLSVFLTALSDESADVVDTSLAAHDGYHDFSDVAWSYLAEDVGLTDDAGEDDHDGGDLDMEATPAQ